MPLVVLLERLYYPRGNKKRKDKDNDQRDAADDEFVFQKRRQVIVGHRTVDERDELAVFSVFDCEQKSSRPSGLFPRRGRLESSGDELVPAYPVVSSRID